MELMFVGFFRLACSSSCLSLEVEMAHLVIGVEVRVVWALSWLGGKVRTLHDLPVRVEAIESVIWSCGRVDE